MRKILITLLFVLIGYSQLHAQSGYFHPEQKGERWGVLQGSSFTGKTEWVHKPKFDLVVYDTLRCRYTGNGCSGFFCFRDNKQGYLWSDGRKLDNEYDALDIYNHVAKKNGKWGGFYEDKNILPFSFDSLIANRDHYSENDGDTISIRFAAKKNGKWGTMMVRTWTHWQQAETTEIVPFTFDNYIENSETGAGSRDGHWQFIRYGKSNALIIPEQYDSISYIFPWIVKVNGKWAPVRWNDGSHVLFGEWDEIKPCVNHSFLVRIDSLWGLLQQSGGGFYFIVPVRATSIQVTGKYDDAKIVAVIKGIPTPYNWDGKALSVTGDLTVTSVDERGYLRVNHHNDRTQSVTDASGKTILEKGDYVLHFKNDPIAGYIMTIRKLPPSSAWTGATYGRFQYSSGVLIPPVYKTDFESFGPGHFMNTLPGDEIVFWSGKDFHQLKLPFRPAVTRTAPELLVADSQWNWYKFSDEPVKVDASAIVINTNTWAGSVTYNNMLNGSVVLTSINGTTMNERIQEPKRFCNDKMMKIETKGVTTIYCNVGNRPVATPLALGKFTYIADCFTDNTGKPGILVVDSALYTLLVDVATNRRLYLPYINVNAPDSSEKMTENNVYPYARMLSVDGKLYKFCKMSLTDPQLCRKEKCTCWQGQVLLGTTTVRAADRHIEGRSTTRTTSNYERVWNSRTNSYEGVQTKRTETSTTPGYTIKGESHQEGVWETCPRCNGKGHIATTLRWNGTSFR